MYKVFMSVLLGLSVNALAIDFITEADVARRLGAQKVIEVSKYEVAPLIEDGSACAEAISSRSARAYVVKKGQDAFLYLTRSGLQELQLCKDL